MQEHRTWVEVSNSALKSNLTNFRGFIGQDQLFLAMVKGNAWGCGTVGYAKAMVEAGADWLGVTILEDGELLRKELPKTPIILLMEFPYARIPEAFAADLRLLVCTEGMASAISQAAQAAGITAKVHIKINTGLNRIGVSPADALAYFKYVASLPNIEIEGACTHFSCATQIEADTTKNQLKTFLDIIEQVRGIGIAVPMLHAANSPATITSPESHLNMVRVGMGLAGLYPADVFWDRICLCFPMTWKTRISYLRHVKKGEGVSYGARYRCAEDTMIATISVGTADGFDKRFQNGGEVLIGGKRYKVAMATMDQAMIDLEGCPDDIKIGDEVVILGKQKEDYLDPHRVCKVTGCDLEELPCTISCRVPRIYVQ